MHLVFLARSFGNQRSKRFPSRPFVSQVMSAGGKTIAPNAAFIPVFLQMSSFRTDVSKLREAAAQQGDIRQAVRDRDETIRGDLST